MTRTVLRRGLGALLPLALVLGAPLALLAKAAAPLPGEAVALVFPPGLGEAALLAAALRLPEGWRLVALAGPGLLPMLHVTPAEPFGAPFEAGQAALRAATGAWLVLRAGAPGGCTTPYTGT